MYLFTHKSPRTPDRAARRGAVWLTVLGLTLLGASLGTACSDGSSSNDQPNTGGTGGVVDETGGSGGKGTGGGDILCVEAPDHCGVMHHWCPPDDPPPETTCGGAGGMGGGGGAGGNGGEGGNP